MRYLYKITNLINGKAYIGQTKDIKKRFQAHITINTKSIIHNAILKYGKENFKFEVIAKRDDSFIDTTEKLAINYYNTIIPNGYNLEIGGCKTKKHNTESINKMKKRRNSKEHNEAIIKSNKTRQYSKETKEKIGLKSKGRYYSEETRLKMSLSHKNKKRKPFTAEHILKLSLSQKGKPRPKK